MASCLPPCDFGDRLGDVGIGAATTDVAAHSLAKFCVRQFGSGIEVGRGVTWNAHLDLLEHRHGRTDLTWSAISALVAVMLDEGGLHGVHLLRGAQPLDGSDAVALMHHRERQA